jgi:putative endonuclease
LTGEATGVVAVRFSLPSQLVIPDKRSQSAPIRDPAAPPLTLRPVRPLRSPDGRQNPAIAVYIMASGRNGTLYTGVTSKLGLRVEQHKLGTFGGFSEQYGCKTLVWFERHSTMEQAIAREKRIKRWPRDWKLALIEVNNSEWRDLSDDWSEAPEGPLLWMQQR